MNSLKKCVVGYYIFLSIFSVFVLLMEFVIPHGGMIIEDNLITTNELISSIDNFDEINNNTIGELTYSDSLPNALEGADILGYFENENVIITIYQIRMYDSNVYVADVIVSEATDILNAFAYDTFGGKNITDEVSDMAEDKYAIFAINADYASHYDDGIVIRNGTILRDSISDRDAVVLSYDGTISTFDESNTTAESLLDDGAWQVWSFGPALIDDSVCVSSINDGITRNAVDNPRTAIGMISANHFMFICVDGRSQISEGVDIEELADIMYQLDCTEAYNLDGGGSSTMWFDGNIINVPSSGDERKVGDCVYILA